MFGEVLFAVPRMSHGTRAMEVFFFCSSTDRSQTTDHGRSCPSCARPGEKRCVAFQGEKEQDGAASSNPCRMHPACHL